MTESSIKSSDKKKIIDVLKKIKSLKDNSEKSKTIRFLIGSLVAGGVAMSAILLIAAKMFGGEVFKSISSTLSDAIEIEHMRHYYHNTPSY